MEQSRSFLDKFLVAEDPPSPTFFTERQHLLSGQTLLPNSHISTLSPQQLPEKLLLTKHVLIHRDGPHSWFLSALLILQTNKYATGGVQRLHTQA